jgi:predicted dehydrogenase
VNDNINFDRRKLLGGALVAAAVNVLPAGSSAAEPRSHGEEKAAGAKGSVMGLVKPKMEKVRFGVVGVGERGGSLIKTLMPIEGIEVTAICDIYAPALDKSVALVEKSTGKRPAAITGGAEAFKGLIDRADVDAVIIATPWEWHVRMALHSIAAGKATFVEVPAATSVEDCWALVEAVEAKQVHFMMMENCCYGRSELMVLNMVRAGVFGELTHGEGSYIHNLRGKLKDFIGEGTWRADWYSKRRANSYPTHGLGPIAQYMNINRGDRFDYLVSTSSPARSWGAYAEREFLPDSMRRKQHFVMADMNTSIIQTVQGRSILLQHDVSTPRPYSRHNLIQGVKGTFAGYPDRIAIDKGGNEFEEWTTDLAEYKNKYDSALWKNLEQQMRASPDAHGGMDFVMLWRIVYCLRNGLPLDQNVYDAAVWSAPFDLSEQSVRDRSRPKDFPDFTRGQWKSAPPLSIGT